MKNELTSKEILNQEHSDPKNWKWGIFYYNKNDGRLLPPKKNPKLGWTLNFANPWSVISFVTLIIFFILFFSCLTYFSF